MSASPEGAVATTVLRLNVHSLMWASEIIAPPVTPPRLKTLSSIEQYRVMVRCDASPPRSIRSLSVTSPVPMLEWPTWEFQAPHMLRSLWAETYRRLSYRAATPDCEAFRLTLPVDVTPLTET